MTPRQLRDSANRPWEADFSDLHKHLCGARHGKYRCQMTNIIAHREHVAASPGPGHSWKNRSYRPGEFHFPVDCPARPLNGIVEPRCMFCLRMRRDP